RCWLGTPDALRESRPAALFRAGNRRRELSIRNNFRDLDRSTSTGIPCATHVERHQFQLVMSSAVFDCLSLPIDQMSGRPSDWCEPGLWYWMGLFQPSAGTLFPLKYGPFHFVSFPWENIITSIDTG